MDSRVRNLTGQRFGRLVAVEPTDERRHGSVMWVCKCDCGNLCKIRASHLTYYGTKSCGCIQKEMLGNMTRLEKGQASFNATLHSYKQNAKKRGYSFNLTKEQFREITQQNCSYCGRKPCQVAFQNKYGNGVYVYNGIDRVNNSIGYEIGNVVPCCKICNRAKDVMGTEEFLDWIKSVYQFSIEGRK